MLEPIDGDPGRSLAEIAAVVQACLRDSPSLAGNRIRCELGGDRIILRGYVATYSMKQMARVLAESVSSDHRVEDRLDVIPFPAKWRQNADRGNEL